MYDGEPIEDSSAAAVRDAANDSNISPAIVDKLIEPLTHLREAAQEKKTEQICAAYAALRRAAAEVDRQEALALADAVLGRSAIDIVVSAYSHRRCFMCDGGTVLCEECDHTGRLAYGKTCPDCEGLGVVECGFCRGTGWAERSSIPAEIAPAVLNRQFRHVKTVLRRVIEALAGFTVAQIGRLQPDKRRTVVARLMQLEWRIEDLAGSLAMGIEEERVRLGVIAQKIHTCLEMLKEH